MSAFVRTREAEHAALWMRVDGPAKISLSFDNMGDRPITGTTDWQRYKLVLDVDEESTEIAWTNTGTRRTSVG